MNLYKLSIIIIVFLTTTKSDGQVNNPVWDIGTKWTYEFKPNRNETSFVINEIVDTITIDNLKLFVVDSYPEYTGIRYFHYVDGKVYNYNPNIKILQLLYDFSNTTGYVTNYRPICDPYFDYDSQISQSYQITIDSITQFQLPDGKMTTIQHAKNEVTRPILANIGFMDGYIHYSHDWEFGILICDELANFVLELRCFENDSVSYNFKNYACDSTWIITAVEDLNTQIHLKIFPNPTHGEITIENQTGIVKYDIFNLGGDKVQSGSTINGRIKLDHNGLNIIRTENNNNVEFTRVINLGDSR